ncbi:MAG: hypothetical protein M0Q26_05875 [Chitinophagaceae bacterium]|nr:hypothetical protein [Chitinophagaceae bacterium]MDP1763411.1 hypothetical protein [Sediminibacterium sp.]
MITKKRIDFVRFDQKNNCQQVGGGLLCGSMTEAVSDSRTLASVIQLIKKDATIYWVSNGDWSMHEMLLAILNITGPATVYLSSYAMSEKPARILAQLKNDGMIDKLFCILDNRIDVRTAGSLQIMKAVADQMVLVDTHAKVSVIQNKEWEIAVIGSANYTENKRYECGVISLNPPAIELQLQWMKKALEDGIQR